MFVTIHIGQGLILERQGKIESWVDKNEKVIRPSQSCTPNQLSLVPNPFRQLIQFSTIQIFFYSGTIKCTLIVLLTRAVLKEWKEARELLKLRCIIKSNIYRKRLSTVSFRQLHYFIIYALNNKNSGTNQCVLVTHSPPFNANIT